MKDTVHAAVHRSVHLFGEGKTYGALRLRFTRLLILDKGKTPEWAEATPLRCHENRDGRSSPTGRTRDEVAACFARARSEIPEGADEEGKNCSLHFAFCHLLHPVMQIAGFQMHGPRKQKREYLFVANGVTTVRNMWGDAAVPHIYSTGPITDGNPPVWRGARVVETQQQAEQAASHDKDAGYVAVKVYNNLSSDSYRWLVSAARARGLPVVGHVPDAVGLQAVVAAGQDSIEHLEGYWDALQTNPGANPDATMAQLLDGIDLAKLPALVESIRSARIWNCPTLTLGQADRHDPAWRREAEFMPPGIMDRYHKMYPEWDNNNELSRRAFQLNIRITRALHQGGARLLLGTDSAKPNVLPGFSLHDELKYFVEAGLSPYEALRAGTSDAAIFLHQENEFGLVATGLRADLVLLEANPLDDVVNASRCVGVMVSGRWFPKADLQKRLTALQNSYHR